MGHIHSHPGLRAAHGPQAGPPVSVMSRRVMLFAYREVKKEKKGRRGQGKGGEGRKEGKETMSGIRNNSDFRHCDVTKGK